MSMISSLMADPGVVALIAITLFAATVNGGLGYGFSSLTVPVAILFYANRVLNPAMVLVEVVVNCFTLFVNRESIPRVWKRVFPMLLGVLPGVLIGSYVLFMVKPEWLKLLTYAAILPLILLQAGGIRRPIRAEGAVGVPFGVGIGILYSVTTISGPPLAVMLNNQGYVKQEFRAALGVVRMTESVCTAITYYFLGLYSVQSMHILGAIAPSVVIGIPFGAYLIRRMDPETFRRICMSFDAWVVGYGLSKALIQLNLVGSPAAYSVLLAVVSLDAWLLYRFFAK